MSEQGYDWELVSGKKPLGYVELNNGKVALYGPIESITIDDSDAVIIRAKWVIKRNLDTSGVPTSDWEVVSNTPDIITSFPNLCVPFVIEDTPEKGPRARFGFNILYFNDVHKVGPSDVVGLHPDH